MEILFIAFLAAIGFLIILWKAIGRKRLAQTQVFWDVILTLGLPILFIGTFSGMATAIIAGIIFSVLTAILFRR